MPRTVTSAGCDYVVYVAVIARIEAVLSDDIYAMHVPSYADKTVSIYVTNARKRWL